MKITKFVYSRNYDYETNSIDLLLHGNYMGGDRM